MFSNIRKSRSNLNLKTQQVLFASLFVLGIMHAATCFAFDTDDTEKADFFENKIRPVLIEHCYKCHSAPKAKGKNDEVAKGGLYVDTREGLRAGGESGAAVVPGKPDESLLIEAMRHDSFEMPPDKKLSDSIIADFEKWIRDGAFDPRDGKVQTAKETIDLEKGREFWSFQPIQSHRVPDARVPGATEIDRFIVDSLRKKSLGLNPMADRETLVRRIYFDLIGLPPTRAQMETALSDRSAGSVEKLIEELLQSKHFGERWGRHWLDVARYADSSGGGRILLFQDAWRYRDYVIESFNRDLPINEFFKQQLAGDLLARNDRKDAANKITATGFLMLGAHNYELQDKELLRMEVVDEQINVMGRSMLGMTITCARCHDHKFDPIPTSDYYALAGIFRSSKSLVPGNVSGFTQTELPRSKELDEKWKTGKALAGKLDKEIAELKKQISKEKNTKSAVLKGELIDDREAKFVGKWTDSTSVKPYFKRGYRHSSDKNTKAIFSTQIKSAGLYRIRIGSTPSSNRATDTLVAIKSSTVNESKKINQQKAPDFANFITLGEFEFDKGPLEISITPSGNGVTIVDGLQVVSQKVDDAANSPRSRNEGSAERIKTLNQELKQLENERKKALQLAGKAPVKVMSIIDHPQSKEVDDFFVCIRGNVHRLGNKVSRGALSVIDGAKLNVSGSGRLELAEWITSPTNPLTSRVYVNRVWLKLMGTGLVNTPDNFGKMGERPTHPELLDYLAADFMKNGWSTKTLIRKIMTSRVYQQSSLSRKEAVKADPQNQLYWKANRRRLDAEAIRDSILAFSGQLDLQSGGAAIRRGTRTEFGYKFDSTRRSVYLPVFRNTLPGLFEVFDFPNPNLVAGKRNQSTLPTQALFMMNSPFANDQSKMAADRFFAMKFESNKERIAALFRASLGRAPTDRELNNLIDFFERKIDAANTEDPVSIEYAKRSALRSISHSLISCLDFVYLK